MSKIIIKLLICCLRLLMDIKHEQTGSHYAFNDEYAAIREASEVLKERR